VNLLTLAGHKLYAPKGIGALYIRKGTNLDKIIHGAKQEAGRRPGTENVPFIVGFGCACEIAFSKIHDFGKRIKTLRDLLYTNIVDGLGDRVKLNGHPHRRLPNTLNISIMGVVGEELLSQIPEIAALVDKKRGVFGFSANR
jgi:cysteine desulfurase